MELKREFPEVKIIAISGGGRIGLEEYLPLAGATIGAQRTFSKPFEARDLLEAIRNLVGGEIKSHRVLTYRHKQSYQIIKEL